jgi:hypothetical protein
MLFSCRGDMRRILLSKSWKTSEVLDASCILSPLAYPPLKGLDQLHHELELLAFVKSRYQVHHSYAFDLGAVVLVRRRLGTLGKQIPAGSCSCRPGRAKRPSKSEPHASFIVLDFAPDSFVQCITIVNSPETCTKHKRSVLNRWWASC